MGASGALTAPFLTEASLDIEGEGGGGGWVQVKGGQAQGPLVKSVHIPLLSEGIRANPGLLRWKGRLITQISIKK